MFDGTERQKEEAVSTERTASQRTAVVLGGTSGIGKEVAKSLAQRGRVYVSGRTIDTAKAVVEEIGQGATPLAFDLAEPETIADALADVDEVDDLVISAIERDANHLVTYDLRAAIRLVTLKLVGYTEAIHTLHDRFTPRTSIVLFGGLAMERPYPGSTTVSTVNGGITGLVRTLASELAPTRVNAVHPGIIGDSPYWEGKDNSGVIARTPLGRLVTMSEITDSVRFLLDNTGVNGVNLFMDGGWLLK
jgi:NAD(P)-dependent dehydrogenase (short-subunit alcohol dehydrogenase family)